MDPVFGETYETSLVDLGEHAFFFREKGPKAAPVIILLHGFPQTGAMWRRVADLLAARGERRIIIPDLPGYGRSKTIAGVQAASKRAWAASLAQLLDHLGVNQADIVGHDRGGRLAYRFALDFAEKTRRLAVLDILPTADYWHDIRQRAFALKIYHWMFLAQPHPFPETMISAQSSYYIDSTLMSWSGSHKLDHFEPAALAQYRANAADQTILRAMCDDYRANASIDTAIDEADIAAGRKIAAPTLAIWGAMGLADSTSDFQKSWTRWCEKLDCAGLPSGHFLPEEAPKETAEALDCFFKTDA